MEHNPSRHVSFEQSAINILGKESVFGKRSLRKLEHKIFKLTGSKVKFSSLNLDLPSRSELDMAKKNRESLIFIPDTMTVTEQRGVKLDQPSTVPITLEALFELFYSQTEAKTIFRMMNESAKEMSARIVPSKPVPTNLIGRTDRNKIVTQKLSEITQRFKGGILSLGGLLEIIGQNYDTNIIGGWHLIKKQVNPELMETESFANKMEARIPSLMELFISQLILLTNNDKVDGSLWLPTNSLTEILVQEPNFDPNRTFYNHMLSSKVRGRLFVTSNNEQGVGVVAIRDDVPQYKKHVLTVK